MRTALLPDAKNTVVMGNCVLDWDKPETWTAMLDGSPVERGHVRS